MMEWIMDFKSENEVVNETLIYSQIVAQYALKRFQDATKISKSCHL